MNIQQKKRLSQTTDLAKVMTNMYNNHLLLTSLLNEQGENRIQQGARQKLTFINKLTKSQIKELESCFSKEFLEVVKEQLTDENVTLQTDGAMDSFLKLDLNSRDFIEGAMNEMIHALGSKDEVKQAQIKSRIELYYILHEANQSTINSILITAKGLTK